MAEKMRFVTVLGISILIFLLGLRTGIVYEQRDKGPGIIINQQAPPPKRERIFYIVEGDFPNIKEFYTTTKHHMVLQFYRLANLRHILRAKKIKIYNQEGKRIF